MLLLAGCATEGTAAPAPQAGAALQGRVHGGQSPIAGAQIYLLAAGTSGYGGASTSLINRGSSGTTAIGQYVVTDAQGMFTITGDYTCTPNSQVYILALGGNPGLGEGQTNPVLALMAVLGNCPSGGSFLSSIPFISINEVTTVAGVYALAGFMTDATHVASSGTALALTDIANAFATAGNLVNVGTGSAYSVTPSTTTGVVPQAEINTLGDILQACVNSSGDTTTTTAACYQLFAATNNGTAPANTVEAALHIAHAPGSNVNALYMLLTSIGAAFSPALSAAPNDWTIGITYSSPSFGLSPVSTAVDGTGNVWTVQQDTNSVTKLSSFGVMAAGSPFTGFSLPTQVALDSLGNAWVTNAASSGQLLTNLGITKIAAADSSETNYTTGGIMRPAGVAIDAANNVWTANQVLAGGNVSRITNAGAAFTTNVGPFGGTEEQAVQSIAIDGSGNAWTTTAYNALNRMNATTGNLSYSNTYSALTLGALAIDSSSTVWIADPVNGVNGLNGATGSFLAGSPFSGGGIRNVSSIALDGANQVWTASYTALSTGCTGQVSGITKTGVAVTPSSGYTTPTLSTETNGCVYSLAIDGSGNIWYAGPGTITEFVGVAVPVHTPIIPTALAVKP